MLVDLRRCIGCQACTVSCAIENQTPQGAFRTLVNQYQVQLKASPTSCYRDCATIVIIRPACRSARYRPLFNAKTALWWSTTPLRRLRLLRAGLPYDARFINHETQTADKCTFCVHRLEAGLLPACVESCVGGARIVGDIKDPSKPHLADARPAP
jgi:tetrathionate reductase subunit B